MGEGVVPQDDGADSEHFRHEVVHSVYQEEGSDGDVEDVSETVDQ